MGHIEQVVESGNEIVQKADVSHSGQGELLDAVGWTSCFPIRLKAKVIGVIFMDWGLTQLQLPEEETSLSRIISN